MTESKDVEEFGSLFKRFLEAVVHQAPTPESPFRARLREHFGTDPLELPVVGITLQSAEHANLQAALDAFARPPERSIDVLGVGGQHKRYMGVGMADLLATNHGPNLSIGPVEYVELPSGPAQTLTCIEWGLLLIREDRAKVAVLVRASTDRGPERGLHVEAIAGDRERASSFIAELRRLMREHNLYRGRVVSLGRSMADGPFPSLGVTFHELGQLDRSDVVLPEGLLERIERHTVGFGRHALRLAAAGRHLRRGLLLYGPPGTGKTHTVTYLAGQMPERTVLLLTGADQSLLSASFQLARELAPAMVVLEDVDLIAEERTLGGPSGRLPLLFALLNELDGLASDADVIAVLTTNRADLIEPALAARPGRVDLAIELPLPDATARHRLLELYGRGLTLELEGLEDVVHRTEGVSPAFIKELLRHAALLAADDNDDHLVVTSSHLLAALRDLSAEGSALTAVLLGASADAAATPHTRLPGSVPADVLRRVAASRDTTPEER